MKKLLSVFLTLLLLCSTATLTANAESVSGTCGATVTWSLDTATGILDIAGTGAMYDYTAVLQPAYMTYKDSIKTIRISDGVTKIGHHAFYQLPRVTEVIIPSSVKTIAGYAFYNLQSLVEIVIPSGVESIGEWAFGYCGELFKAYIPDSVTFIDISAFNFCLKLFIYCNSDSEAAAFAKRAFITTVYMDGALETWKAKLPAWMSWAKDLAPIFQWIIIIFFGWVWFLG